MPEKQRFISTRPSRAGVKRRSTRPLWAAALLCAGGLAAFHRWAAPRDPEARGRFEARRAEFVRLRDMILAEPALHSVGEDNVGDFWLFDGAWTTPRRPYQVFSRREMLDAAGLSPEKYAEYLSRLRAAEAYRVSRAGRQAVFHLISRGSDAAPRRRIVYASRGGRLPSPPGTAALGGGWFIEPE